jgi:hypothetical protein
MSCCIEGANGVTSGGGGGAIEEVFSTVVDIDWREEFNAVGAVDLNSSGAVLTDQAGAAWVTPAQANGDSYNQNNGSTSWGLTANGLEVVDCVGAVFPMSGTTAATPHIYINLRDLAQAYGFDGDPMRPYILQCYVSAQNDDEDTEISGCGINKMVSVPAYLGVHWSFFDVAVGFAGGLDDAARVAQAIDGNPASTVVSVPPAPTNVPTVQYNGLGSAMCAWIGTWNTVDDVWPVNGDLRFLITGSTPSSDQGSVGDPFEGFRISLYHQALGSAGGDYNAVIQRTRLLQGL